MKHLFTVVVTISLLFSTISIGAVALDDMSDDAVIVTVDEFDITVFDFKWYRAGFGSIRLLSAEQADYILDLMVIDLLFQTAAKKSGLSVADEEVIFFQDYFFAQHSLSADDRRSYDTYFYMNDPYYSMDDFYIKSHLKLLRVKYLAWRGYIESVTAKQLYISTKGLSHSQKKEKKQQAMQIANNIMSGNILFNDALKKHGELFPGMSEKNESAILRADKSTRKYFTNKNIERILKAGIFKPIFIESKIGFHIILNIDYALPDAELLIKIIDELKKEYTVTRKINFSDTGR